MKKYILFDTETTGNKEEDRIIQFGAIIVDEVGNIETYNELCYSDIQIKLEAMEVHNITPNLIKNKPKAIETNFYKKLLELNSKQNYLIAHNSSFDLKMVEKEGFENQFQIIDTLRCSKHLFPQIPYHRLQYLRYALEIYKNEESEAKKHNIIIKAHDAIGDVLILKLFLSKLVKECRTQYSNCNPMEKLVQLSKTPVFIKTFTFGKYKGKDITEVGKKDIKYLNWMKNNLEIDEDLKYTLKEVISSIDGI